MSIERWLGAIAGLAAGLAVLYHMYGAQIQDLLPHPPPEVAAAPAPPPAAADEAPQYPLPEAAPEPAAPAPSEPAPSEPTQAAAPSQEPPADLSASDTDLRRALGQVFGEAAVDTFLVHERVVQKIVATIDSLDRQPAPMRMRAILELPGQPLVEKDGDAIVLSPDNGERYRLPVEAFMRADPKAIAALYVRHYPLFQRAYRELGYPRGYFNDRLVKIIDHLLATPEPAEPIVLARPKVLYQFADEDLEALSSGQKAMLRMGRDNRAAVKEKLGQIRAIVAARGARPDQ